MEHQQEAAQPRTWSKQKIALSTVWSFVFLIASLFINYCAGTYATVRASRAVNDIILDNVPVVNVDFIFAYGIILFFAFVVFLLLSNPHRIAFVLKTLSLFIVIRSFFVILTHLGPILSPSVYQVPRLINKFTFDGDMFFSAHTGMPFLMALIFWQNVRLRRTFFALSCVFGLSVLLGHLHYSIDVFSAFFITYGIYRIAVRLFVKDFDLFRYYARPQ